MSRVARCGPQARRPELRGLELGLLVLVVVGEVEIEVDAGVLVLGDEGAGRRGLGGGVGGGADALGQVLRVDRRGLAVDTDDEQHGTDGDDIAGPEFGVLDTLAVDEGAVARAEVTDADAGAAGHDLAVVAGDLGGGDPELAVVLPADEEFPHAEGDRLLFAIGTNMDQGRFHRSTILSKGLSKRLSDGLSARPSRRTPPTDRPRISTRPNNEQTARSGGQQRVA